MPTSIPGSVLPLVVVTTTVTAGLARPNGARSAAFSSTVFYPLNGALTAALGWREAVTILGALYNRQQTGKGRRLQVAMQDAMVHYMRTCLAMQARTGEDADLVAEYAKRSATARLRA